MNVLHGEIKADQKTIATWEAQYLGATEDPRIGLTTASEWECCVDTEPDGIPQRATFIVVTHPHAGELRLVSLILAEAAILL